MSGARISLAESAVAGKCRPWFTMQFIANISAETAAIYCGHVEPHVFRFWSGFFKYNLIRFVTIFCCKNWQSKH